MFHKNTFRHSLYATALIVILTLTGVFATFEGREVIADRLFLDTVLLALMAGGTGYLVAFPMRERGMPAVLMNALIGSSMVAISLALVVVIQNAIGVDDLRFVFQNLSNLNPGTLTFGQELDLAGGEFGGLLLMVGFCLIAGVVAGIAVILPARVREVLIVSTSLSIVIGLITGQVNDIMALPDAILLIFTFGLAYIVALNFPDDQSVYRRVGAGVAIGLAVGIVMIIIGNIGGSLEEGGFLYGGGSSPRILSLITGGSALLFVIVMIFVAEMGTLVPNASKSIHDTTLYFMSGLFILGVIDWQGEMTLLTAGITFAVLCITLWFVPQFGQRADAEFEKTTITDQRNVQRVAFFAALAVLVVAPQFMGLYISNVFNLIALYMVMGIGLNVMIGYTGLLDLGYVASFAIGAYALGILTTPNLLTCGGADPLTIPLDEVADACTGMMTFWTAWPLCVLFSAITGAMLGIPVLRLRGDYLAIVTLGFGEITNRIILSNDFKPILGGAQGITPIPSPVIDLTSINEAWYFQLSASTSIYYLFLFSAILTAFVVARLANSRTGRAWRAVREDEDVAQAMGINLVRTKLLAFGISSAFAGLGGAAFGASVQGIFPNSFTLLVSINVLSLIIIGGMGSIPGVMVGAMLLIGLPELLRELDAYRLLVFGALLVIVMLVKPEGLLPPSPPELSEVAEENRLKEQVSHG